MKLLVYIKEEENIDVKSEDIDNRVGFIEGYDNNFVIVALNNKLVKVNINCIVPIDYYDGFVSVNLERLKNKYNKDLRW